MTDNADAWDTVHEALPARWRVGPVTYDPGRSAWSATAVGPHPGRGKMPLTVSGTGQNETAALRDLNDRLRGVPKPDGTELDRIRRRLRLAYLEGAEEWSQANTGRGLTTERLAAVIDRFPTR